eukprot:Gb_01779 [translate_table: standard]
MAAVSAFERWSNLLCGEDASNVVGWDDEVEEHVELPSVPDFPLQDDEIISLQVQKECDYMPKQCYLQRYRDRTLDFSARQKAIDWILKVHAYYNFGPLTAYLSINYLDRFLSRHQLPNSKAWMFQLLSVACLSLAAKMEEIQVPLLLDLQAEEPKFIFEALTVQRMELLILTTLEWRMLSITPFSFIDYFFSKGGNSEQPSRNMVERATELILSTGRVMDFLEHRPSAIAAAAVLCASEEERIFSCYNLMQEMLIQAANKPKSGSSSIPQSPVGVLDAVCWSNSVSLESNLSVNLYAAVAAKRRKLNDYCHTLCMSEHNRRVLYRASEDIMSWLPNEKLNVYSERIHVRSTAGGTLDSFMYGHNGRGQTDAWRAQL